MEINKKIGEIQMQLMQEQIEERKQLYGQQIKILQQQIRSSGEYLSSDSTLSALITGAKKVYIKNPDEVNACLKRIKVEAMPEDELRRSVLELAHRLVADEVLVLPAQVWNNHRNGEEDKAHDYLSRAIAIRPDFDPSHAGLGRIAWRKADRQTAVTHYEAALAATGDAYNQVNRAAFPLARRAAVHGGSPLGGAVVRLCCGRRRTWQTSACCISSCTTTKRRSRTSRRPSSSTPPTRERTTRRCCRRHGMRRP